MRIGHLCRIAGFSALIAALPGAAANATMISDTTKNVSYWGGSPYNWYAGGTSSVGDVVEGGPDFDTNRVNVSTTTPYTLKLGFYTQFSGSDLGAHYADIFLATDPAHPDVFNYGIALGFQAPYGGVTQGLYALSGNYQTSIDRWKNTGYIYGGQYISPNDNLGHNAPTVITSGSALSGWTIGVTQSASGDSTYPYLLSVSLTAMNKNVLDSVFSHPSFAFLWGTGDCNNDSVYVSHITRPPDEVPEPPSGIILAGGLLGFAFVTLRNRATPVRVGAARRA
jgi:hypothetical protein